MRRDIWDFCRTWVAGLVLSWPVFLWASEVQVAVAANFAAPMKAIAAAFERDTRYKAVISLGSTGQLEAQIRNGAPFAVLLAADTETPMRLERDGLVLPGSRIIYAVGRLALFSRQPGLVDPLGEVLRRPDSSRIAIAHPTLAPYGAAAIEVMQALGLAEPLRPRLVQGVNVAQAHQFVLTGNAAMGFVSVSQIMENGQLKVGSAWVVPAHLHRPLRQEAVALKNARDNPAAQALMRYLTTESARALIRSYGYEI